MIGRLNHVAIAVPRPRRGGADLSRHARRQGVRGGAAAGAWRTTVFVTLPNTKIELLEPLGEASPIAKFLEHNPDGGMHHVCYEVDDIVAARDG